MLKLKSDFGFLKDRKEHTVRVLGCHCRSSAMSVKQVVVSLRFINADGCKKAFQS